MAFPRPFGRYMLDSRIAMGGMAEIFRAHMDNAGFQKRVCIKCVLPHFLENETFVSMFRDEASLAAKLQHANIVQVFDFGEHEGSLFLAMEFIDGADLKRLLKLAKTDRRRFTVGQVLQIGIEVARGLHYAHTLEEDGQPLQIVHRDVSPHNILLSRQGEVKVADFGIAKAAARATHTGTGVVKGKLAYMAPEQAEGGEVDHRLDQFALGVVLWEALTGERLFHGGASVEVLKRLLYEPIPSPRSVREDLPADVDELIMVALDRDPDRRFKDLRAFERAMTRVQYAVSDDPADSELRGLVQSLLELSTTAPRRTAILAPAEVAAAAAPEAGEGESILSLTEAGFDDVADDSEVFASTPSGSQNPSIELTGAGEPGAPTELVDKPALEPEADTGATGTVVPELPVPGPAPLAHEREAAEHSESVELALAPPAGKKPALLIAAAALSIGLVAVVGVSLSGEDEAPPPPSVAGAEEQRPVIVVPPPEEPPPTVASVPVEEVEPAPPEPDPVVKAKAKAKAKPKPKPKAKAKAKETGTVYIDVIGSWAVVFSKGAKQCDTPCTVTLPAGRHKLRLRTPGGDKFKNVNVVAGRRQRLIVRE